MQYGLSWRPDQIEPGYFAPAHFAPDSHRTTPTSKHLIQIFFAHQIMPSRCGIIAVWYETFFITIHVARSKIKHFVLPKTFSSSEKQLSISVLWNGILKVIWTSLTKSYVWAIRWLRFLKCMKNNFVRNDFRKVSDPEKIPRSV